MSYYQIKYKVIQRATIEGLEEDVNEHLSKGWELLGGVSAATPRFYFAQALTKKESV